MSRIALLITSILLLGLPPAWAGELSGSVKVVSSVPPRAVGKKKEKGYKSSDRGGLPPGESVKEEDYVVIMLEGKGLKATPRTAVMSQQRKQFVPHVLAVAQGSKIRFENNDRIAHHIYSVSRPGAFKIPRYTGKSKTHTFPEAAPVEIFCGIHPRMNAYIVVAPNDFFSVCSGGKYSIKSIPAGEYTVKVWHPRLKPVTKKVTIVDGKTSQVDFDL